MSANVINCGGCLRDDASKIRGGGGGIYWRWSREAVGKHAEVGDRLATTNFRRIHVSFSKKMKRHQAHAFSLARR